MILIRKLNRHHVSVLDSLRVAADFMLLAENLAGAVVAAKIISPLLGGLRQEDFIANLNNVLDSILFLHDCYAGVVRIRGVLRNAEQSIPLLPVHLVLIAVDSDPTAVLAEIRLIERVSRTERIRVHVLVIELCLNHADRVAPDSVGKERNVDLGAFACLLSAVERHQYARKERAAGRHVAEGVCRQERERALRLPVAQRT